MFGRRSRFDEKSSPNDNFQRMEYMSFSDFIRQQFLKQRNIFDSTAERPKTASGKGTVVHNYHDHDLYVFVFFLMYVFFLFIF